MFSRKNLIIVSAWITSLVLVALLVSPNTPASGQTVAPTPETKEAIEALKKELKEEFAASQTFREQFLERARADEPNIMSGPDIGFRVEGQRNGAPTGTMVVRIDGTWRTVESAVRTRPLH
jgi:hypothetical protein